MNFQEYRKIENMMDILVEKTMEKSTCLKRKVGSMLYFPGLTNREAFNGPPLSPCLSCERKNSPPYEDYYLCNSWHAETKLIITSSLPRDFFISGKFLTTFFPCKSCAINIVGVGIRKVFFRDYVICKEYENTFNFLKKSGVEVYWV